jgi:3'-phosphoadenosine 5'-phosphosulfate sulfotransferase (PAPS reductase)/FAD synthetase
VDAGHAVWSWQGIRLDESHSRRSRLQGSGACVKAFEVVGGGISIHRPILRWTVADVFEAHRFAGVKPNPLYTSGMGRVGCMPCINAGKDEILEIARRFPEHIERIAKWEQIVNDVCRPRSPVSFFHKGTQGQTGQPIAIHSIVEWAKTARGGRQFDMFRTTEGEPAACASSYGLCDPPTKTLPGKGDAR